MTTTIQLDKRLHKKLKEIALKDKISLGKVIEFLLEEHNQKLKQDISYDEELLIKQ